MIPKIIRSSSLSESDSDESEDDYDGPMRFKVESKLNVKRLLQILVIVLLFLVSASILIVSLIHDVKERGTVEFEEFSCSASDSLCLTSLCPLGMDWDVLKQSCNASADTLGQGVMIGAHKEECSQGFVWVNHRHRCMR